MDDKTADELVLDRPELSIPDNDNGLLAATPWSSHPAPTTATNDLRLVGGAGSTNDCTADSNGVTPGMRCIYESSSIIGAPVRYGTVRYVGPITSSKVPDSIWVGIELDDPIGKSDGT